MTSQSVAESLKKTRHGQLRYGTNAKLEEVVPQLLELRIRSPSNKHDKSFSSVASAPSDSSYNYDEEEDEETPSPTPHHTPTKTTHTQKSLGPSGNGGNRPANGNTRVTSNASNKILESFEQQDKKTNTTNDGIRFSKSILRQNTQKVAPKSPQEDYEEKMQELTNLFGQMKTVAVQKRSDDFLWKHKQHLKEFKTKHVDMTGTSSIVDISYDRQENKKYSMSESVCAQLTFSDLTDIKETDIPPSDLRHSQITPTADQSRNEYDSEKAFLSELQHLKKSKQAPQPDNQHLRREFEFKTYTQGGADAAVTTACSSPSSREKEFLNSTPLTTSSPASVPKITSYNPQVSDISDQSVVTESELELDIMADAENGAQLPDQPNETGQVSNAVRFGFFDKSVTPKTAATLWKMEKQSVDHDQGKSDNDSQNTKSSITFGQLQSPHQEQKTAAPAILDYTTGKLNQETQERISESTKPDVTSTSPQQTASTSKDPLTILKPKPGSDSGSQKNPKTKSDKEYESSVPAPVQKGLVPSVELWNKYKKVMENLKNAQAVAKKFETENKRYAAELALTVRAKLNQVNEIDVKNQLRFLRDLITEKVVYGGAMGDKKLRLKKDRPEFTFALLKMAEQFVKLASSLFAENMQVVFPTSIVAMGLASACSDFLKTLLACIYEKCPWLVPYLQQKDLSKHSDLWKDVGETRGVIRLYSAMCIVPSVPGYRNPLGPKEAWRLVASISNMAPKPIITVLVLDEILTVAGNSMGSTTLYRKQFRKLIRCLRSSLLPKLEQLSADPISNPIFTRLHDKLEYGKFDEPEGFIHAGFWRRS